MNIFSSCCLKQFGMNCFHYNYKTNILQTGKFIINEQWSEFYPSKVEKISASFLFAVTDKAVRDFQCNWLSKL